MPHCPPENRLSSEQWWQMTITGPTEQEGNCKTVKVEINFLKQQTKPHICTAQYISAPGSISVSLWEQLKCVPCADLGAVFLGFCVSLKGHGMSISAQWGASSKPFLQNWANYQHHNPIFPLKSRDGQETAPPNLREWEGFVPTLVTGPSWCFLPLSFPWMGALKWQETFWELRRLMWGRNEGDLCALMDKSPLALPEVTPLMPFVIRLIIITTAAFRKKALVHSWVKEIGGKEH